MNLICELNDKIIFGQEGLSSKLPRLTARAIVRNREGFYAVMYADKFKLYSLPGGGVENGEDILEALRREVLEETGCTCDRICELGIVRENRACQDYTQESYYYVVDTQHIPNATSLTEAEMASNTTVQWHTFDEMWRLIHDVQHDTVQRMYLQARDVAALKAFSECKMG